MKKIYRIEGLDCPHCAAKVEAAIQHLPGVQSAQLHFMLQKLTIEADEKEFPALLKKIRKVSREIEDTCVIQDPEEDAQKEAQEHKRNLARILLSALLLILVSFLPLSGIWRLAAFLVPYALCGWDVLLTAVKNIAKGRVFDEQFLMALATLGALFLGEYQEAVAVMIFYQTGEWFQHLAVNRSRRSIAELMDLRPDAATVLRNGAETVVPPQSVKKGETLVVRPGEKIPLDGVILSGQTSLHTAALTGESLPQDCGPGDRVISGSLNMTGLIHVEAQSDFSESTVCRILDMVENASEKKARVENFITRFSRYYTPCVVTAAAILALLVPLLLGQPFSPWIRRALIFLVVSCPCALVVSVPMSFFGGIGGASRRGILVKGADALETLAHVKTVAFDKTGTLTQGSFSLSSLHPQNISPETLLTLAASVEKHSNHPLAQSICAACSDSQHRLTQDLKEHPGLGVQALVDGRLLFVGNARLMQEKAGISQLSETPRHHAAVHVAWEGEYLGYLLLEDTLRFDSAEALEGLRRLGVKHTVLLTGDTEEAARSISERLGITQFHARLLPGDKVTCLESLLGKNGPVAFVGDGINDAPVLSRADVGIAMGAMGSDAAMEAADVVLMESRPSRLAEAIGIARKTLSIVRQNIVLALSVKAVVLLLSVLGAANMWLAVFADVGVLVLAILNAMRTLKFTPDDTDRHPGHTEAA